MQLVAPVRDLISVNALHPTAGLAGFPAHDWFAPGRSPVVSPAAGHVTKLSGHPVAEGMIDGPHGPYGLSLYITDVLGNVWYLTHMASRAVQLGQPVKQGSVLGTVALWPQEVTPAHIHMGVHVRA